MLPARIYASSQYILNQPHSNILNKWQKNTDTKCKIADQKTKWKKFTYVGRNTKYLTKLFNNHQPQNIFQYRRHHR